MPNHVVIVTFLILTIWVGHFGIWWDDDGGGGGGARPKISTRAKSIQLWENKHHLGIVHYKVTNGY